MRDDEGILHSRYHLQSLWATGALALAGCLWGTGFFFGKIAFAEMSVLQDVMWRFIFGSVFLVPMVFRGSGFSRKDFGLILLAAIIGVPVQFLIQFKGLELTTVSHASLMVGTLPMLLAFSSVILLHEHLTRLEWGALFASAAGAILIAFSSSGGGSGSPHSSLQGDLLVFLSMIAAGAMILISKRLMDRHPSLQVTSTLIILGTLLLLICTAASRQGFKIHFSLKVWSAAAAQGIFATALAYLLWNWGLARVPASRSGVFLNLEPLVGAGLGVTLLEERLGISAIFGAVLILGSAVYFSRTSAAE